MGPNPCSCLLSARDQAGSHSMSMTAFITIPVCRMRKAKLKKLTEQLTFQTLLSVGCALRC